MSDRLTGIDQTNLLPTITKLLKQKAYKTNENNANKVNNNKINNTSMKLPNWCDPLKEIMEKDPINNDSKTINDKQNIDLRIETLHNMKEWINMSRNVKYDKYV